MIDGPARQLLPRYTTNLISLYRRLGLSPNQITLLGLVTALVAATFTGYGFNMLGLGFWWGSRLFDGTDGIYARATGRVSAFGGYIDIVLDMAAYGCMILGFAYHYPEYTAAWLVILFFYILCITSALALGGIERQRKVGAPDNRTLRLATGLAEGGETGFAYSLFLLLPSLLGYLTWLWIIILAITVVTRTILAWSLHVRTELTAHHDG